MKNRAAKRTDIRAVEDDLLATARGLAAALYRVGAVDAAYMRDIARLCLRQPSDVDVQQNCLPDQLN